MAYFSQDRKKEMAPKIKAVLAKYGVKGSLAVRHHSTVVLNIRSGAIDFITNYNSVNEPAPRPAHLPYQPAKTCIDVNPYWYKEHFSGIALEFLKEVMAVLYTGNHDRSDIQSDYFDVGWYVDVNIGQWDKPYILEGVTEKA